MVLLRKDIKELVEHYKRKFGTSNPYKIADELHIELAVGDIGSREGCYMYLKKHKCIFLNENLEEHEMKLVMAHELGHALLDRKSNCYFIRNKTLLLNSKLERRANLFAAYLLITDEMIIEHKDFTESQFTISTGYPKELIELRLK